ncbi:MAG TPA: ATP-dependent zinc metalloprotease FtsH [Phycisphaerae bacterium]|nr:ATP-dependent zinc metalloprotease FtsH [Phycisphaerae bacterium]
MAESDSGNNRPSPPQGPMRLSRGVLGWIVFIGCALLLVMLLTSNMQKRRQLTFNEFLTYVKNDQLESVQIKEDLIVGMLKPEAREGQPPDAQLSFEVRSFPQLIPTVVEELRKTDAEFKVQAGGNLFVQLLVSLLPWVLIFAFIWFFIFRQIRSASTGAGMLGHFGRSRHRISSKEHTNVTFADVAGIDEAKEEVTELVEFLKNPKKFHRLGGRIPRGVLLVGEPGCGKTLLAKAIAGQADVPFFSISGSDFVEMFVGVGASRVRDLFKQAKEHSPCIIFLDEIDAVGRRRGAGFNGGGHDEREQTLNAILVEMDGFDSSDQVIVIAATNRADVLDPALIRPGRFDRQVVVSLPDIKGRLEILKIYAAKVKLGPDADLERLARGTPLFSGADLAAIINEAALLATLANKQYVEQEDLEEGRDKIRWGRARKSRAIDEQEKVLTAYHEAGHTLLQCLVPGADPLHKVSIIPRGQALGATFNLPEKDRYTLARKQAMAQLTILLGGRIAEKTFCEDVTSGAANDIKVATSLARTMVCDWGMNEKLGPIRYSTDDGRPWFAEAGAKEYSDHTAETIDEEIRHTIDEAQNTATELIEKHRDTVEAIAQALLKYETLDSEDVKRIIDGQPLDKPTVSDLLAAEQARKPEASAKPKARPAAKPDPDMPGGALPQPGVN